MHIVAIGGSDAGISAALRARELDPNVDVTVVVADSYPNFSICGIPYYFTGDVHPWQTLAHRTSADLEATGMRLRLDTFATRIRRFNLGLADLSERTGVSIIDVDSLLARAGADRLKLDALHLTAEGYRLVAEEVVRVLEDLGLLQAEEATQCAPA